MSAPPSRFPIVSINTDIAREANTNRSNASLAMHRSLRWSSRRRWATRLRHSSCRRSHSCQPAAVGQIRSDCRRGVAGVKHAPSGFHCCPFGRTVADFTVLGWSDGAALGHDGPLTRPAGVRGCPSCAEGGVARLGEATRRGHSGGCCARAGVGGHLEEVENPSRIPGQATHGLGDGEPARLDEADGEAA